MFFGQNVVITSSLVTFCLTGSSAGLLHGQRLDLVLPQVTFQLSHQFYDSVGEPVEQGCWLQRYYSVRDCFQKTMTPTPSLSGRTSGPCIFGTCRWAERVPCGSTWIRAPTRSTATCATSIWVCTSFQWMHTAALMREPVQISNSRWNFTARAGAICSCTVTPVCPVPRMWCPNRSSTCFTATRNSERRQRRRLTRQHLINRVIWAGHHFAIFRCLSSCWFNGLEFTLA